MSKGKRRKKRGGRERERETATEKPRSGETELERFNQSSFSADRNESSECEEPATDSSGRWQEVGGGDGSGDSRRGAKGNAISCCCDFYCNSRNCYFTLTSPNRI